MDKNSKSKNTGKDKAVSFLKQVLGEVVEFKDGGEKSASPEKPVRQTKSAKPSKTANSDKETKSGKKSVQPEKIAISKQESEKIPKTTSEDKPRRKERRTETPPDRFSFFQKITGKVGDFLGTNDADGAEDTGVINAAVGQESKSAVAAQSANLKNNVTSRNSKDSNNSFLSRSFLSEKKHRLGIIAAAVLVVCLAFYFFWEEEEQLPTVVDYTPIYVNIKGGMAATQIGRALEEQEIIVNSKQFLRRARKTNSDSKFQSGIYRFHKGMRIAEVLDMLVNGKTSVIRFTIPEGFSLREMAQKFEAEGIVKKADFMAAAKKYVPFDYIGTDPDIPYFCEGYLFPDTYEVQPGTSAQQIIALMARTFDKRFTKEMRDAAQKYNLTFHEFVTLASLVEKEAMYDEDRPIIAQVFLKRLRVGMMLQSDAPIQYLRETPKEDLTFEDLKVDSPYNTYLHYGLPPGPIASPGLAALNSLVRPADTDYLYFVADRQGHNHYSTNFSDHQALVEKYR